MKVVFFTNFLTHHQLPFCQEMYRVYGKDFILVSTEKINQERINLGYEDLDNKYPFVLRSYDSKERLNEALRLSKECDVAIYGSTTSDIYAKERLKMDKLSFRYYARIFYKGPFSIFDFKNLKKVYCVQAVLHQMILINLVCIRINALNGDIFLNLKNTI